MASPGSSRRERRSDRRRRSIWIAVGVVVVLAVVAVAVVVLASGGNNDEEASTTGTTTRSDSTATTGSGGSTVTTRAGNTTGTTAGRPGGPCKAADVEAAMSGSTVRDVNAVTVVTVTNTGGRPCTINGAPGVQLLGPDDAKVQTTVVQGGGGVRTDLVAKEITVDPGAKASFVMSWDQVSGTCADVRSFDVTLPADSKAVKVKSSVTVCGNGTVNVSPFQPGIVNA